jgi:hypothetical protein
MIEKCSIGNISYNIQNITLIILMLILIIVIIYYLKNSGAKHEEIIEKYTAINTNTAIDTSSYQTHNSVANSVKNSQFPTAGTVVTLRDCQVQFNNDGTSKYEYKDGWKEIDTLEGTPIEKKIISHNNETNKDDKDRSGKGIFVNYTEHSKCFKKMDGATNTYKYQGNNLIKYNTSNHTELKVGANGVPENYMEMAFDLNSANSLSYYDNLVNSICSLNYSTTITGLSGDLIRLTLNNNNIITAIDKVTIDSTNNHIFNIDNTFHTSNLITSTNSGTYTYTGGSYQYFTTNTASSGLIRNIDLYKFDRNLLCDITSNIKTYTKLNNAKINIANIINFNLPTAATSIANTTLPERYSNNITITGNGRTKDTLVANMDTLINNELEAINGPINISITAANAQKGTLETIRNNFVDANNTKQTFINNAIIKGNYEASSLKYNTLLNTANYNLILGNVEYNNQQLDTQDPSIKVSSSDEPTIKEILNAGEQELYEILEYKYDGSGDFTQYDKTFLEETICDILIIGGGGAGGNSMGGGGGAGGVVYTINQRLVAGTYTIGVGRGGLGLALTGDGQGSIGADQDGKDSFIQLNGTDVSLPMGGVNQSLRGKGGGGGGVYYADAFVNGRDGGSGGGCTENNPGFGLRTPGSATQGNTLWNGHFYVAGGKAGRQNTTSSNDYNAGGGGGAGNNGSSYKDGNEGVQINITGNSQFYAAGGGGGQYEIESSKEQGIGGSGIGGNGRIRGKSSYLREATSGANGTGSGGGGGAYTQDPDLPAGSGGSGIVIIRYKNVANLQNNGDTKNIRLQNQSITQIYRENDTLRLNSSIKADILLVGGGGAGGSAGGGGGGGDVQEFLGIDLNKGNYEIIVGKGGNAIRDNNQPGNVGENSSIKLNNTTIIAAGGGGGGAFGWSHNCGWCGGQPPREAPMATFIHPKTNATIKTSGGGGGVRDGNGGTGNGVSGDGGKNNDNNQNTGGAGGGAGGPGGNSTLSGNSILGRGGVGIFSSITGQNIEYGGGGSGARWNGGVNVYGGASGGGGSFLNNSWNAAEDGKGGGGTMSSKGGSGIVIIKYHNSIKSYRLRVGTITYFTIVGVGTNISRRLFLHGIYKIEISSTNTKIMKDPSNSLSGIITLDIEGATNNELNISSNQIDITYNLRKSIADINKTQLSIPSGTAANIVSLYNASSGGIPFNNNKYNRYKISTNISKTYKKGTNIDFNIELYTMQNGFITSDNYDIRYVFPETSNTNVIIPIDIYLTIKPISNISGEKIIVKTYSKTLLGTNEAEIYAFIGNATGSGSTSIDEFNSITSWDKSLSEKNVWGIVDKTRHIITLESSRITIGNDGNIVTKCDDMTLSNRDRICDIKNLIIIKNTINTATFSTTAPSLKNGISITSSDLFLSTSGSSILNYSITDYISYESATVKTPANRTTTFNILDNATKYVYFAIA